MRILFFGTPAFGHLLPLLPLAAAARRAGHHTALVTHASMADAVAPLRVLPAGATVEATLAEVMRRTGADAGTDTTPATPAEFFGGARVDLGVDEALVVARDFAPDLIIAEVVDCIGPLVAAALNVPWASHGWGLALDEQLTAALDRAVLPRYAERGLTPTRRLAHLDPWPDRLHRQDWTPPGDRITVRPEPHSSDSSDSSEHDAWSVPRFAGHGNPPLVLVTLGRFVDAPDALAAIVRSLASLSVNVVITLNAAADPQVPAVDRTWVRPAGFVPMRQLLQGVDAGRGAPARAGAMRRRAAVGPTCPAGRWASLVARPGHHPGTTSELRRFIALHSRGVMP
ncbi:MULTISPECIES: hypothetical protein [unclassified Streptomyces]|uniref:hypothetical protein n=1 Tax=unclassified Streptomyces TaxID=2593676 RepID=UPI0032D595F1